MMKLSCYVAVVGVCASGPAFGDVVGREDFDGGDLNLMSSFVPALDGGPGDYFGVGSRNAWPQGFPDPGVPFSIGDDSVFGYSNGAPFGGDNEGIFGMNSDLDNRYFAMSDSDEFGADQTANWTFNISGYTDLSLSMDMGGVSSDSFGGFALGSGLVLTASIDGGAAQVVFDASAIDNFGGFVTRAMDGGAASGGGRILEVLGDNAVTKLLAEDGSIAGNTYFDKTPSAGAGAGQLDTFLTNLNGSGSSLVLTLTADMPFEAIVFDNIVINGVPAPGAALLLALGGMVTTRRRR